MKFRQAIQEDIGKIMPIIKDGQEFLKEQGVNQWQDNYPDMERIRNDINNGYGYIVEDGPQILATVAISFDGESTYDEIFEGQWLSNGDYCVVHRLAIQKARRGSCLSSFIMDSIDALCKDKDIYSIKIDTHRDNIPMQQYLKKNGFKYCGIIYLLDGDERLAFEKLLK